MATRQRLSRRRRRSVKEKGLKLGKKLFPIARALSAPVAFLEQISAKHRQTLGSAYSQAPVTQKLKIMANEKLKIRAHEKLTPRAHKK